MPRDAISIGDTIYIDSSYNIGFNRLAPNKSVDISGGSGVIIPKGTTSQRPDTAASRLGCLRYNTTTSKFEGYADDRWIDIDNSFSDSTGASRIDFTSDNLTFYTNDTERMVIDSTGNVGINISSPTYELDINGGIQCGQFYLNESRLYSAITHNTSDSTIDSSNFVIGAKLTLNNTIEINDLSAVGDLTVDGVLALEGNVDICGTLLCNTIYQNDIQLRSDTFLSNSSSIAFPQPADPASGDAGAENDLRFNTTDEALETSDGTTWATLLEVPVAAATVTSYMIFNHAASADLFPTSTSETTSTGLQRLPTAFQDAVTNLGYEILTNDSSVFSYTQNGGEGFIINKEGLYLATITYVSSGREDQTFRYMFYKDGNLTDGTPIPYARDTADTETNSDFVTRLTTASDFGSDASVNYLHQGMPGEYIGSTPEAETMYLIYDHNQDSNTYPMSAHQSFQFALSAPSSLIFFASISSTSSYYMTNLQIKFVRLGNLGTLTSVDC